MVKKIFGFFLVIFVGAAFAVNPDFKEGKHYQQVPYEITENEHVKALAQAHKNQVIVLEFFSYGCHWCNELEPHIRLWLEQKKPDYVIFIRNPVVFQNAWVNLSKAYYTAESLNKLDKTHAAMFKAIHTSHKLTTASEKDLEDFFKSYGVSKDDFTKTFESFGVEQAYKQANQLASAFKITSIPAFIVMGPNGAFLTSTRMAGSEAALFEVIDALSEEEHRALVTHEG